MILVDTSVLIDFFKGTVNPPSKRFRRILESGFPFGITSLVYLEVLQGAKSKKEYGTLKKYLSTQRFYHPLDPIKTYEEAAHIYFNCRKKGITIRSTIDCLIAQIAIEHNLLLLHNDTDFLAISKIVSLSFLEV